jgi:uncharacterized membrane protein YgaE (UPF0421/DUF939 family)
MTFKILKRFNNEQLKDGTRLGLQSAFAGALCYYLMFSLSLPEKFVGILSAVLVIESSIGNTFQQAKGRLLSTLVGIGIGFTFVVLIPWELGTILSLIISLFIINYASNFRPEWRYGVVAAVALALGSEDNTFILALNRLIGIGFGISIGILTAFIIWPETADSRALKYIKRALKNTSERFTIEFNNTRDEKNKSTAKVNNNFSTNINQAKKITNAISFSDKSKKQSSIKNTEKLYNSITIIERIAEKSKNDISNGESGIEKNSEKVTEQACSIIEKLASGKEVETSEIESFTKLIKTTKSNINEDNSNKDLLILRHTFIFGLSEINESLVNLCEDFK